MLRLMLAALCVMLGTAGYIWYSAPPAKSKAAPAQAVAVSTLSAARQDIPVQLSGIGAVQALNTVQLRSRVRWHDRPGEFRRRSAG